MQFPKTDVLLKWMDFVVKPLVWISVVCFLVETQLKTDNSLEGPAYFLWIERSIAPFFTIEWVFRFYRNKDEYRKSVFHGIDLIAIIPFWVGFPISWWAPQWLHLIRTLRILRMLKFFRYSRSMQLVGLGFYRAWPQVKSLTFSMFIIGLFSMVAMYEAERKAQPEDFDNLFNAAWFTAVTCTTVGYGDISPVTVVGKCVAMFTFGVALTVFAAIVGVLGNSFTRILEEEVDPDVDPIAEFQKTYETHLVGKQAEKDYEAAG